MMRFRVAAQFFTIAVLVGGALIGGPAGCHCVGCILRRLIVACLGALVVLVLWMCAGALYGLNPKKPKTFEEKLEQEKQQK